MQTPTCPICYTQTNFVATCCGDTKHAICLDCMEQGACHIDAEVTMSDFKEVLTPCSGNSFRCPVCRAGSVFYHYIDRRWISPPNPLPTYPRAHEAVEFRNHQFHTYGQAVRWWIANPQHTLTCSGCKKQMPPGVEINHHAFDECPAVACPFCGALDTYQNLVVHIRDKHTEHAFKIQRVLNALTTLYEDITGIN